MYKGIIFIILSGLSFMVVNFFVKLLGAGNTTDLFGELQNYPAHELVLARSLVSFIISLAIVKKRKLPVFGNNKKWLIIRGLSGTIALTIFFYTIHHLPLAIASIIQYLAPIFTVILAMILLKEKVKALQWVFIAFSFLGVGLISFDKLISNSASTDQLSFTVLGLGIFAALLSGLAYTSIMKLKSTDKPITIVMYFPMIAIPLMLVLCFFEFTIPTGIEWVFLLIIGLFTQSAQILLTKALHLGNASTITPFQYLGAIYAFLIGFFVFDETLSWLVNVGIIIILSSLLLNALLKRRRS